MASAEHEAGGPVPCRHEDVVARIYAQDRELAVLKTQYGELLRDVLALQTWREEEVRRLAWFHGARADLEQLVESKRWIMITRHVIAWTAGAVLSGILFWNTLWPILQRRGE
jgi:hypothetical protein